jgi:hypothetical protein
MGVFSAFRKFVTLEAATTFVTKVSAYVLPQDTLLPTLELLKM